MSHIDAPLYVHAHDLTVALTACVLRWPAPGGALVGAPLCAAASALVHRIGEALAFPAQRAERLAAADSAIVDLRVRLRVSEDVGLLDPAAAQRHGEALVVIGRMLGGWRKRCAQRAQAAESVEAEPVAEQVPA